MAGNRELRDAIRKALQEANVRDLGEAERVVARVAAERNHAALDDFDGLSPEQMGAFLHAPFDSPELVTYLDTQAQAGAPVIQLYSGLADALGEKGLKATAKGNLPRKLLREVAEVHFPDGSEAAQRIYREEDFFTLHVVRLLADLAGLVRLRKGRFHLTAKGRRLREAGDPSPAYWALFRAYAGKFNWGYADGYPELFIVQQSFLFALRLLQRFGDDLRPSGWYADAFLRAFPPALREAEPDRFFSAEDQVKQCFSFRMERFGSLFGLIEVVPAEGSGRRWENDVRKLPLLEQSIRFAV